MSTQSIKLGQQLHVIVDYGRLEIHVDEKCSPDLLSEIWRKNIKLNCSHVI